VSALPGFLTRNWTLKLSAFGIALLLWVSVRVEAPNRQAFSDVPVRVDLTDPQWALVDDPSPAVAMVRLSGSSRELMRMALDRPTIVIPLDRVDAADTTVVLQRGHVRIHDRPGVSVDDIQPQTVRLTFEPLRRLDFPVAVRVTGQLPDDLALAAPPRAVPGELRVSGPESRVLALDSVRLQAIDLGEAGESGRIPVPVDTTGMRGLQVQPLQAEVELVLEERVDRVLGGIPIVFDRAGWEEEYEMEPEVLSVTVSGARSLVERLLPRELGAVVDHADADLPEEPGDARVLPVRIEGVPPLLDVTLGAEGVMLRRRPE
jgi:YbbR domain-containing protein